MRIVDMQMGVDLEPLLDQGSLVINGGYYSPQRRPEGVAYSGGRLHSRYLRRIGGGILTIQGPRGRLLDGEERPRLGSRIRFAIQCSPRLVADGQVVPERDTGRTAARTALCLRDAGRTLDVYILGYGARGRGGPTIFETAQYLRAEGCEQALNLDGGPSTGVAWIEGGHRHTLNPLRGIRHAVVISRRGH